MLYQFIHYLRFLKVSKNQHGVHSPFVYNIVTQCFYNKTHHKAYDTIKHHRCSVFKDKTVIQVTDLGAGSTYFRGSTRVAKTIGKIAGISLKRAKLLNRLVRYLNAKNCLELGTSVGLASVAMVANNNSTKLTSVEGCLETAKLARTHFKASNFNSITVIQSNFNNAFVKFTNPFDLIFVDGNHTQEATLRYFKKVLPLTHNNSVLIFDDIYLNKGMTQAWNTIKQHPKARVTIDTFKWGIVFFRTEQAKEHFTIRV